MIDPPAEEIPQYTLSDEEMQVLRDLVMEMIAEDPSLNVVEAEDEEEEEEEP